MLVRWKKKKKKVKIREDPPNSAKLRTPSIPFSARGYNHVLYIYIIRIYISYIYIYIFLSSFFFCLTQSLILSNVLYLNMCMQSTHHDIGFPLHRYNARYLICIVTVVWPLLLSLIINIYATTNNNGCFIARMHLRNNICSHITRDNCFISPIYIYVMIYIRHTTKDEAWYRIDRR